MEPGLETSRKLVVLFLGTLTAGAALAFVLRPQPEPLPMPSRFSADTVEQALHPATPSPEVEKVSGAVRVEVDEGRLSARLELVVRAHGQRVLAFEPPAGWKSEDKSGEGFVWEELSQDGRPCRFMQTRDLLLVELTSPAAVVTLRARYRARPGAGEKAHLAAGRGLFVDVAPRLPGSLPAFDVNVLYQEQSELEGDKLVEGTPVTSLLSTLRVDRTLDDKTPPPPPGTWSTARLFVEAGREEHLGFVIGPFRLMSQWLEEGEDIRFAAYSDDGELGVFDVSPVQHFYRSERLIDSVFKPNLSFAEPLRYVELERGASPGGTLVNGLIIADPSAGPREHEAMARQAVRLRLSRTLRDKGGAAARWSDAFAEQLVCEDWIWNERRTWPKRHVSCAEARQVQYDQIIDDVPLLSTAPISQADRDALSYGKAAKILRSMWRESGDILEGLTKAPAGQVLGWEDLARMVGERSGRDAEAWFRDWLTRPGAPALELEGEIGADGQFHGAIVQTPHRGHPAGAPPFRGEVEVRTGWRKSDCGPFATSRRFRLSERRTEVTIPLTDGDFRIELDPSFDFPRHRLIRRDGEAPRWARTVFEADSLLEHPYERRVVEP